MLRDVVKLWHYPAFQQPIIPLISHTLIQQCMISLSSLLLVLTDMNSLFFFFFFFLFFFFLQGYNPHLSHRQEYKRHGSPVSITNYIKNSPTQSNDVIIYWTKDYLHPQVSNTKYTVMLSTQSLRDEINNFRFSIILLILCCYYEEVNECVIVTLMTLSYRVHLVLGTLAVNIILA